jgi:hypothetical protein
MSSDDRDDAINSQENPEPELETTTEYFEYQYDAVPTRSTLIDTILPNYGTGSVSRLEEAVLSAKTPININETTNYTVRINGIDFTGTWINRDECLNWRGPIPLDQYKISTDTAQIINKNFIHTHEQVQNVNVKLLKPPPIQPPCDLVIRHEPDIQIPPAPPIIIRQQGAAAVATEPKIYREKPPRAPAPTNSQTIMLPGRTIEPPPRRVIIERMPAAAPLPQDIIIERWLGYPRQKRRVTHIKPVGAPRSASVPRNVLIDWSSTNNTKIRQRYNFLGIESATAEEYERRFGRELLEPSRIPIPFPSELDNSVRNANEVLATNATSHEFILHGDVEALNLVDRRKYNMSDYLIPQWMFRS